MGAAVESRGDAGVRTDDLDVLLCVSAGHKDLIAGPPCCERPESMGEGNKAPGRKTRGRADHIGFLDAAVERPLGIRGAERLGARRVHQVRVQDHDLFVFCRHSQKGVTEFLPEFLAADLVMVRHFYAHAIFLLISTRAFRLIKKAAVS